MGVDTSTLVLTTLKDAGRLTTIPYLQEAAGLALGIVAAIQGARDNKDAFQRLSDDACGLVYATILCKNSATDRAGSEVSKEFLDNLRELVGTLTKIESFAKKQASRNAVIGIIRSKSAIGTIQEYRETLRQSLDLFGLKSSITIQDTIARLSTQQEELMTELRKLTVRDEERCTGEQNRTEPEIPTEILAREPEVRRIGRAEGTGREDHRYAFEQLAEDHLTSTSHHTSQRQTNPFRTYVHTSGHIQPNAPFVLNPYRDYQYHAGFPHIHSSSGQFEYKSIGGNQITTDMSHHVVNNNSGNTVTTITENSNNDSSIRTSSGSHRVRRRRAS